MSDAIISDTDGYTDAARPSYGYHDRVRRIVFAAGTPADEQLRVMKRIHAELAKGSMWAHGPTQVGPDAWTINHGYDSGD